MIYSKYFRVYEYNDWVVKGNALIVMVFTPRYKVYASEFGHKQFKRYEQKITLQCNFDRL